MFSQHTTSLLVALTLSSVAVAPAAAQPSAVVEVKALITSGRPAGGRGREAELRRSRWAVVRRRR